MCIHAYIMVLKKNQCNHIKYFPLMQLVLKLSFESTISMQYQQVYQHISIDLKLNTLIDTTLE